MTFAAQAIKYNKTPVNIVQITLDTVAGSEQTAEVFTFSSAKNNPNISESVQIRPFLLSEFSSGQEITLNFTRVNNVTITMLDVQESVSSYWRKWLAKNKFYVNRPIEIKSGFEEIPLADYKTEYKGLIENISIKTNNTVTIKTRSVLQFSDDKVPKEVTTTLRADISNSDTLIPMDLDTIISDYPATGHIKIGRSPGEIIEYTSIDGNLNFVTTLANRAKFNDIGYASATAFTAGTKIQLVNVFDNVNIIDAMTSLMTLVGVSGADVNTVSFTDIRDLWFTDDTVRTVLDKPKQLKEHLKELRDITLTHLAVDENFKIKLFFIAPPMIGSTFKTLTTEDFVLNSFAFNDGMKERINAVIVFYDFLAGQTGNDQENYKSAEAKIDTTLVTQYKDRKSKILLTNWLKGVVGGSIGRRVAGRLIASRGDGLDVISFKLASGKADSIEIGQQVFIEHPMITDSSGVTLSKKYFITKKKKNNDNIWDYSALDATFKNKHGFISATGAPNFENATVDEKDFVYIGSTANNTMIDGSPGYFIF